MGPGMPGGPFSRLNRRTGPACSAAVRCGDLFGCVAALQLGPAIGGAKIAHPIDNAVRRNEIAVVAVGKHHKPGRSPVAQSCGRELSEQRTWRSSSPRG